MSPLDDPPFVTLRNPASRVSSRVDACVERPLVLLVDDDAVLEVAFRHILDDAGYTLHIEPDCRSCYAFLDRSTPAVAILDLHLPDGTGLECLQHLRRLPEHQALPVAMLTGDYFLDSSVAASLTGLGARIYFKPVWEDDLLQIVGQLMTRRVESGAPAPQRGKP